MLYLAAERVFVCLMRESGIEYCIVFSTDNIPQLRLAHSLMAALGKVVVGMHLYRQVFGGIDEFHHYRKHVAIFAVCVQANHLRAEFAEQRLDVASGIFSIGNNRLLSGYTCQFPTLSDTVGRIGKFLQLADFASSPNHCLQVRFKLKRVCIQLFFHCSQSILLR